MKEAKQTQKQKIKKGGEHSPVSPFFINFIKLHVDNDKSILWMGGDESFEGGVEKLWGR